MKMNPGQHKIVILEAYQLRRNYLKTLISAWGYTPYCFDNVSICLDNLPVLLPDMAVYGTSGSENSSRFLASLRLISRKLPVLILPHNNDIREHIHTNGFAPVITLEETANPAEIRRIIYEMINNPSGSGKISDDPLIIGNSPELIKIKQMIPELSRSRETVLIKGEAGTGKELIAKSIYFGSDGRDKPFVKVHAAAIPPAAAANKKLRSGPETEPAQEWSGARLLAGVTAGTVFLDRIELLPADLQIGLLQIFEGAGADGFDASFDPSAEVRIIAAADTELEPLVENGQFRKDLYYRLNVLSVTLPPLRNRKEDIPLLADFFSDKFCLKQGRGCFEISSKIKTILCSYHWPGNVGELENMIREMVVSGDETKIMKSLGSYYKNNRSRGLADFFDDFIQTDLAELRKVDSDADRLSMKAISRISKMRTEGELILKALEAADWNRKKAAKMLNISYKSLLNKIKAYDLGKKAGKETG